jgi:hypothetical protein
VFCLIVVPLPPGRTSFAVKISKTNDRRNNKAKYLPRNDEYYLVECHAVESSGSLVTFRLLHAFFDPEDEGSTLL